MWVEVGHKQWYYFNPQLFAMVLLSDKIQEFIDWLNDNTDFSDWHENIKIKVHKKLIECMISVPQEKQMQTKLMTVTVVNPDGSTKDTIVWGGDDSPTQAASQSGPKHGSTHTQTVLFTTSVTLPSGVRINSIIWGS